MAGTKNNQAEKLSIEQMRAMAIENMASNAQLRLPALPVVNEHDGAFVIVGGGPSVLSRLGDIERRQRNGAAVVACNGANLLLRKHGIVPDYALFLDPQEIVADYIEDDAGEETTYLTAVMLHPKAMAKLTKPHVFMFHAEIPEAIGEKYHAMIQEWPVIPTSVGGFGNTVCLRAINIGHLLGYREFHLYGVDSSYPKGGADHAYVNSHSVEPDAMEIRFDGKMYTASPWMVVQADDFKKYHLQFHNLGCRVKVHGDGLMPDMSRHLDAKRTKWLIWKTSRELVSANG